MLPFPDLPRCAAACPLQVAQACGASSPHLYKVLRVLAHHEMLDELPGKHFAANDATRELVQVGGLRGRSRET